MKKVIQLLSLILLCVPIIGIGINAFAKHAEVLEGYEQVTYVGGTNDTNTVGQKDGVVVSKTIEESGLENYFDITLKVQTQTKVEEIITDQDLAIVVVMDISNTMVTYKMSDGTRVDFNPSNLTGTRLESARLAAEQFIDDFATYSTDVEAQRKLGFVVFNKDAHDVFNLQDCTTSNKESLKTSVTTKTDEIINAIDENGQNYNGSYNRFTNIEAGLKRADEMLDASGIKNKYIIFISDGYPTTYVKSGVIGYNPYMQTKYNSEYNSSSAPTSSGEGKFYNELSSKLCTNGTSYSDEAAIRAASMANSIKASGTSIYTIGIGINNQTVVPNIAAYLVDVDKQKYEANGNDYELGSTTDSFKAWLRDDIGSNYLVEPSSTDALKQAYADIFEGVKSYIESSSQATWVADDPMNSSTEVKNIGFVGFYDDKNVLQDSLDHKNSVANQSDTASFDIASDKISWDLKYSECDDKNGDGEPDIEVIGDVTYYNYSIKYRVRLENENDNFSIDTIYDTNGETLLTYVLRVNGVLSSNKYISFEVPSVVGYVGNLEFTKKSSQGNLILSGAQFKLVHNDDVEGGCDCLDERVHASNEDLTYYATSDSLGKVVFSNIPSGHKYKLIEVVAPTDHILSDTVYDIEISYGTTTGGPPDTIFINDIQKGNLEIEKVLEGNTNNSSLFDIKLEVWFNGELLSGMYTYKVNDSQEGQININVDTIKLGQKDKMVIYDLPVGAIYKVTETTTDGYQVKYQVNSNAIGEVAICNSTNSCRLENGSTNLVKIINYAEYMMPATGSSSKLLMIIIGTLLLVGPVIYTGYSFYRNRILS